MKPAVLQVKFDVYHPGHQWSGDEDIVLYARRKNLLVVGYSTLSGWPGKLKPVDDPIVAWVADRLGLAPPQVLLRHALQKGLAVIPRSCDAAHARANARVGR